MSIYVRSPVAVFEESMQVFEKHRPDLMEGWGRQLHVPIHRVSDWLDENLPGKRWAATLCYRLPEELEEYFEKHQ